MSLTEEQIKNLKKGDPITVHGTFIKENVDGDIVCRVKKWVGGFADDGTVADSSICVRPSCVSLFSKHGTSVLSTKQDPCRKFKKGDVVEPKQVKGRVYSKDSKHLIGKKCIVFRDEEDPGYVVISYAGKNYSINAAYLELVTPVEELNPYSVLETDTINGFDIMRDGLCVMTFPYGSKEAGYYRDEIGAKEAAEAECKRLNDEHRKEQNL